MIALFWSGRQKLIGAFFELSGRGVAGDTTKSIMGHTKLDPTIMQEKNLK